jgi:hypothetical protein
MLIAMITTLLAVAITGVPLPTSVPSVIARRNTAVNVPLWVSAESAVNEQGDIRSEMFDPVHRGMLLKTQQVSATIRANENAASAMKSNRGENEPPPCTLFAGERPRHWSDGKQGTSFEALVAGALAIYEGKVTAVAGGFFDGQPASLLKVDIVAELRSSAEFDTDGGVFVHYPTTEFVVGKQRFCARGGFNDYRPQVGDQVMIYALHSPVDARRKVVVAESRDLFFESKGSLISPQSLRTSLSEQQVRTLDDLRRETTIRLTPNQKLRPE